MQISRFIRHQECAEIVAITPEMARELIASSPGNRRLRPWYVSQLAAAMKRGEWRITSQGVGIDRHGRLRDAHHRMHAVDESGMTVKFVVVMGLEDGAYEVTDTGMKRNISDLMNEDRRVSDVFRLAALIATGSASPTVDQIRPFVSAGLGDCTRALVDFCGTARKFFSSAPIKLAAAVTILNGGDAAYVMTQYRALCTSSFDEMSGASKALKRQVEHGAEAGNTRDALARGLRVFDQKKADVTKIQISQYDIDAASALVRTVLLGLVEAASTGARAA